MTTCHSTLSANSFLRYFYSKLAKRKQQNSPRGKKLKSQSSKVA